MIPTNTESKMQDNKEQLEQQEQPQVINETNITDLQEEKKKRGNPTWGKGMQSPNPTGRPYNDDREKKTNREIRTRSMLQLLRKFSPHQSKAIMAAVKIVENEQAADANKLKASALIIQTYRELLNEVYSKDYDDNQGEEIQDNSPVFSLKMIGDEKVA